MEITSKPITESIMDSKLATYGSIGECQERVVGFPQKEGADLDESLAPITEVFSWKEGVDLVEGFASDVECFGVHGRDIHVFGLLEALCGLLFGLHDWYFRMDEICTDLYLCYFDRFNLLVLVLYKNLIIFVRSLEQLIMQCLNIFSQEN